MHVTLGVRALKDTTGEGLHRPGPAAFSPCSRPACPSPLAGPPEVAGQPGRPATVVWDLPGESNGWAAASGPGRTAPAGPKRAWHGSTHPLRVGRAGQP